MSFCAIPACSPPPLAPGVEALKFRRQEEPPVALPRAAVRGRYVFSSGSSVSSRQFRSSNLDAQPPISHTLCPCAGRSWGRDSGSGRPPPSPGEVHALAAGFSSHSESFPEAFGAFGCHGVSSANGRNPNAPFGSRLACCVAQSLLGSSHGALPSAHPATCARGVLVRVRSSVRVRQHEFGDELMGFASGDSQWQSGCESC